MLRPGSGDHGPGLTRAQTAFHTAIVTYNPPAPGSSAPAAHERLADPDQPARPVWTFVLTSLALFMAVLDNLVVLFALPSISADLDASVQQLEWTVNAFTLTFAVALLPAATLGDRFGRRVVARKQCGAWEAARAVPSLTAIRPGSRVAHDAFRFVSSSTFPPRTDAERPQLVLIG